MRRFLSITLGLMLSAGTAIAGPQALTDAELESVDAKGLQLVTNDNRAFRPLTDQQNNLDSVQLNHNAQQNSNVAGIVNSAKSAVNASANIIRLGVVTDGGNGGGGKTVIQKNQNEAYSHHNVAIVTEPADEEASTSDLTIAAAVNVNKQTQQIQNSPDSRINRQNNNNNSTQLNDNAQQNSVGVSIINASTSAVNFGINVASASSLNDTVHQSNFQAAVNMSNEAVGGVFSVAGNAEMANATQTVNNMYAENSNVRNQNNNNNSVQVNDNAQESAVVKSILNSAQSAVNIAGNIAELGDVTDSSITQSSINLSANHSNTAVGGLALAGNLNKQTQNVDNASGDYLGDLSVVYNQNNNNNSVQVNDNGQRAVTAVLLENAASSATNVGLNALGVGSLTDSSVRQSNIQIASNYDNTALGSFAVASNLEIGSNPGQYIHNVHATIDQDNNNNSVQLNQNAQADIKVDKAINAANSAVNAAQNLLHAGDVVDSSISQVNIQEASNHNNAAVAEYGALAFNLNKQTQVIENCYCTDLSKGHTQDNNMNSVQANDNAQQNAVGTMLINAADSAVNGALNLLAAATVTGSHILQSNVNVATNFSNFAMSSGVSVAANAELGMGLPPMIPILP